MQYHPDRWVNGTEEEKKDAEDKFKEAAEAYDVLSTPEKKSRYDQFGHAGMSGGFGGGGGAGFDISDIFSRFGDIFGGMGGMGGGFNIGDLFGGGGGGQQRRVQRGGNIRIKVKLTLEEAATDTVKKIKVKNTFLVSIVMERVLKMSTARRLAQRVTALVRRCVNNAACLASCSR